MSLLLDALKRAEQEKLTRHADRPAPEPAAPRPAASAPVLELQPLGGAAGAPRAETSGAQAAQAVFKAKAPLPAARNGRRVAWIAAAVAIVLVAAGAASYLWYTLRALAPAAPAIAAIRRPAPIAPPAAAAQPAPPPAAAQPAPNPAAIATTPSQDAAPRAPAAQSPAAAQDALAVPPAPAAGTGAPDLGALLREAQPAPQPPVELARTEDPAPRVAPDVQAGYGALVGGDLDAARRHYEAALADDPANLDAQLGLATAEARSGRIGEAAAAYERALELDPNNPTAAAGLAALADPARPEALENALRADVARHPQSAALRVTLGDLLAGQRRWAEAQAAYFDAQRLRPGDPDIAYNLAVSLDHLGQRRPAAEFYRRALEARRTRAAQFDAAAASRRLAELSR